MNRLAGYVFDSYDDVDGRILRSIAQSADSIPPFVKTAARLSEDDIKNTPDDQFALVMFADGAKMKKFAHVDAGNTALSVMYLLKQAHLLPPQAVKVAATNLIGACERFGLEVPSQLKIAAKSGMSPVSGKSKAPYAKNAPVSHIQFPTSENPKESTINPRLGHADGANDDVNQRTNLQSVQGEQPFHTPPTSKEKEKTAGAFGDAPGQVTKRQQSWRESPYVDVSSWDPAQAQAFESRPAERTLIGGQYPIDGYDQVKTASAYFEENWKHFEPRKRHEYCVKLASRMGELGMPMTEELERYGSSSYAADVDMYVEGRRGYVQPEFHQGLDLLLEKRAQVNPETFAEALCEFDTLTGLNWHWDSKVADPWSSTFGPSIEKTAAENWVYDEDGVRIGEAELKRLALNGRAELKKQFGGDFADEFAKKPKEVFSSMPAPNKKVLARMASQMVEGI